MGSWRTRPDAALLRAARSKPDAFEELYLRHEPVIAAYLQRRTRDAELTADLTAETFAQALACARQFVGEGTAVAWLLGIARNEHLQLLRRGRVELRACQQLGIERAPLSDESLERVELLLDARAPDNPLTSALASLPDAQREAVLAFVADDRPYAELAAALGVSEATIRQRVSRGLGRLRSSIEGVRS
jgi:RNA polymerase sigma factor (sigma-70 family)